MRYYLQPGPGEAAGLSVVSPPCKQVTHRSPSQSRPGGTPASKPCANTRFEIQSPAQKVTRVAGLVHRVHHMLSLGRRTACASSLPWQPQEAGRRQETSDAITPRVPIGSREPGSGEDANEPLPVLSVLRVRITAYSEGSKGARRDALKLLANCCKGRRDPYADWLRLGRPAQHADAVGGREREVSAVPAGLAPRRLAVLAEGRVHSRAAVVSAASWRRSACTWAAHRPVWLSTR